MKGEDICTHITENIFFVRYDLILTTLLPGPISKFTDYRQFDSKMKISIYTICSKNFTNKDFHEISTNDWKFISCKEAEKASPKRLLLGSENARMLKYSQKFSQNVYDRNCCV